MNPVIVTPLKKIHHPKGDVFHAMKATDPGFSGFGEAYFTTVHNGEVKGWKKHLRMTMNLVTVQGNVRFYFRSPNNTDHTSVMAGDSNYVRITVPPGYWVAFEGFGETFNLVLNLADLAHDPTEAENAPIETFSLGV
jgi:dTDP-4-dehydrorhamnose 3,5-epimerase